MNKNTKIGFLLACFLMGVIGGFFGNTCVKSAHADNDGSMINPLNRIARSLERIDSTLVDIKNQRK